MFVLLKSLRHKLTKPRKLVKSDRVNYLTDRNDELGLVKLQFDYGETLQFN